MAAGTFASSELSVLEPPQAGQKSLLIGITFDAILVRSRADGGTIAALTFRGCTVNLH